MSDVYIHISDLCIHVSDVLVHGSDAHVYVSNVSCMFFGGSQHHSNEYVHAYYGCVHVSVVMMVAVMFLNSSQVRMLLIYLHLCLIHVCIIVMNVGMVYV